MSSSRNGLRTTLVALRAMIILTLVLGVAYPLVVTGIGAVLLPGRAGGSTVEVAGAVVGSSLIGQSFTDATGNPLPEYFQSRPSAAGEGYDGAGSSGSNLGPENPDLIAAIQERRQQVAAFNDVEVDAVPPDAVTASSSGLDPHISPAYARLQVARVAAARSLPETTVRELVEASIASRDLGFLGEETVNVLELNVALDGLEG
ncbi:potassium-transporting ATPase subunit KdpC [Tessaracoccus antarcticus]|uniref:Potassium-transporting ATPase KdpC subunit n=1 Tax=Tessaracoccus antarcticus TaxID=2479848 RepID=A0A3M0GB57_9ACTN|nr:potassium-transporting ATPase subunit KdpC [Tessaracoccus antarcticus]RMB58813.1 potassium-transporting ATPase subunit KdpC [Tessaracoccus antarcticus]